MTEGVGRIVRIVQVVSVGMFEYFLQCGNNGRSCEQGTRYTVNKVECDSVVWGIFK